MNAGRARNRSPSWLTNESIIRLTIAASSRQKRSTVFDANRWHDTGEKRRSFIGQIGLDETRQHMGSGPSVLFAYTRLICATGKPSP